MATQFFGRFCTLYSTLRVTRGGITRVHVRPSYESLREEKNRMSGRGYSVKSKRGAMITPAAE